jgi:hypothetical protein
MDKITIETGPAWLQAKQLTSIAKHLQVETEKLPPLYIKETVVYEFYKFTSRKAMFTGIVIGMAISVAIAALVKLGGI